MRMASNPSEANTRAGTTVVFAKPPPKSPVAPKVMMSVPAQKSGSEFLFALELEFNLTLLLFGVPVEYNGPHLKREAEKDSDNTSEVELRRHFLDKISYLCDTDKGGPTVTSGSMGKLLHVNVL
jgi:hypothetical protein